MDRPSGYRSWCSLARGSTPTDLHHLALEDLFVHLVGLVDHLHSSSLVPMPPARAGDVPKDRVSPWPFILTSYVRRRPHLRHVVQRSYWLDLSRLPTWFPRHGQPVWQGARSSTPEVFEPIASGCHRCCLHDLVHDMGQLLQLRRLLKASRLNLCLLHFHDFQSPQCHPTQEDSHVKDLNWAHCFRGQEVFHQGFTLISFGSKGPSRKVSDEVHCGRICICRQPRPPHQGSRNSARNRLSSAIQWRLPMTVGHLQPIIVSPSTDRKFIFTK